MKSIFEFTSYRAYLKDCFEREKAASRKTTLSLYAKRLGMSASNLNMIFSGQRNLSIEGIHTIASAQRLSPEEYSRFESMVLIEHLPANSKHRRYYAKKIQTEKKGHTKSVRVSNQQLLSDWLVPALLIYLIDFEFKEKPARDLNQLELPRIAQQFRISVEHLKALLTRLQTAGVLNIDSNDRIHIVFDKLISEFAQQTYIRELLKEFTERLKTEFKHPDSIYRAFTFTIDRSAIGDLRNELMSLTEKYMAKTSQDSSENVILQMFFGAFSVFNGVSQNVKQ